MDSVCSQQGCPEILTKDIILLDCSLEEHGDNHRYILPSELSCMSTVNTNTYHKSKNGKKETAVKSGRQAIYFYSISSAGIGCLHNKRVTMHISALRFRQTTSNV